MDAHAQERLARRVGALLVERGLTCATAESCTGGWVAQVLTSVAGSSDWFECGFVTYSNAAKRDILGVSADLLVEFGAVSEATAAAMASGALARSAAGAALAVTGIAGPDGGTPDKPVGTVAFAWVLEGTTAETALAHFSGDRTAVRRLSVEYAIDGLCRILTAR